MAENNGAKKIKKTKTTLQKYKTWRNASYGLAASEFAMPLIPFGVVLGLNWSDWVGNSQSEGWSIGVGFGMLIVATIMAMIGIWKKNDLINSKVSAVFYVAVVFAVVGFGLKLMASMINQLGDMFLYVALGIVGSGAVDQVNKAAIKPRMDFYSKLVKENGLTKTSAREMDDVAQAKKEGEEEKAKRAKKNYL